MIAGHKNTIGYTAFEFERDHYKMFDDDPKRTNTLVRDLQTKAAAGKDIVMVDIGANIGFASITFAMQYPTAKVYSYELNPGTYAALLANIKRNGLQHRVHAFNRGIFGDGKPISISRCSATIGQGSQVMKSEEVWKSMNMSSDRWASADLPKGGSAGFRQGLEALAACRQRDDALISIPSATLAEAVQGAGSATVDFLKMDCEGCEVSVAPATGITVLDELQEMKMKHTVRHTKGECHVPKTPEHERLRTLCQELL